MKQRAPLQSACKSFEEDLVLYYYGETDEVDNIGSDRGLAPEFVTT